MGKPIIWSGTNAKLINAGDLVDRNNKSLTDGGKSNFTWTSHGYTSADVGRPICVASATTLSLAKADSAANAEVVGFIYSIPDANTIRVSFGGNCPTVGANVLEGGGSLTAGTVYFLSDTTAGKITATEPATVGSISKPLAVATGTGSMYFINYRGNTVGSTNARTQISLSNNSTTNMQNCASYDAGSIEGWIYIDATTDYRFYFRAPFSKIGAGTDYYISPSYVGDTPPAGFTITINSSGQSIVTLPSIAGFVSATCTYSLNAPAVGTNFPLALDSANLTNSGITGLTGTAATNAIATGSSKIGEYKVSNPASTVSFGASAATTNVTSITLSPGIYILNGLVRTEVTAGSANAGYCGISTSNSAFDSLSHVSGFGGVFSSTSYFPTTLRYVNVQSTTTYYLNASTNYSLVPTGGYTTQSFIQAIRIA